MTLRVDDSMRQRIERVREQLDRTVVPGQRGMTFSDAARHCLDAGLDIIEARAADTPIEAAAPAPPAPEEAPPPKAPRKPRQKKEPQPEVATDSMDVFTLFENNS